MSSPILQSPLLLSVGVPHAFSTRHGGVSTGAFASLNFGNPGDLPPERRDPESNIKQNWGVLKGAIAKTLSGSTRPLPDRAIVEVHQVHARRLAQARLNDPQIVKKLFDTLAPRYATRPGGYIRIVKLGQRKGDGAEMVQIELVEE